MGFWWSFGIALFPFLIRSILAIASYFASAPLYKDFSSFMNATLPDLIWFCVTVPMIVIVNNVFSHKASGWRSPSPLTIVMCIISSFIGAIVFFYYVFSLHAEPHENPFSLLPGIIIAMITTTIVGKITQDRYIKDEMKQFNPVTSINTKLDQGLGNS